MITLYHGSNMANAPFRAFQYSFHTPEALATLTFKEVLQ